MATQNTTVKRDFDINFIPDYEFRACAGAKGPKQFGRPAIFESKFYKINTKESGTVVHTYLFFGGVPTKKTHEKLDELGYKVRRRSASYTSTRNGQEYVVNGNDKQCYAVYYFFGEPTKEQLTFIAGLTLKGLTFTAKTGKTFLLPTWDAIDKNWGDRNEWLKICTVQPEPEEEEAVAEEEDESGINLDDFDDML
jgi:alpha-glucosidase (family GH31 glycosyl hydrolase)